MATAKPKTKAKPKVKAKPKAKAPAKVRAKKPAAKKAAAKKVPAKKVSARKNPAGGKSSQKGFAANVRARLGDIHIPGLDALLNEHRKNMETLSSASQAAMDGYRAYADRQSEMVKSAVERVKQPRDERGDITELLKDAYSSTLDNMKELQEIMSDAQREVQRVVSLRAEDTLAEIRKLLGRGK